MTERNRTPRLGASCNTVYTGYGPGCLKLTLEATKTIIRHVIVQDNGLMLILHTCSNLFIYLFIIINFLFFVL